MGEGRLINGYTEKSWLIGMFETFGLILGEFEGHLAVQVKDPIGFTQEYLEYARYYGIAGEHPEERSNYRTMKEILGGAVYNEKERVVVWPHLDWEPGERKAWINKLELRNKLNQILEERYKGGLK